MRIEPLSSSKKKMLCSLDKRKYRVENGLFAVEGTKAFLEIYSAGKFPLTFIVATRNWIDKEVYGIEEDVLIYEASNNDLQKISNFITAPEVIGYFQLPEDRMPCAEDLSDKLTIALDGIQDPGNMGTIIRLADWWGVENIFCSKECADCFSPKVVQASMGALGRVDVYRIDSLKDFILKLKENGLMVYGAYMEGVNIFEAKLSSSGILIMGSEGNGISYDISKLIDCKITIPPYPAGRAHVESLNVATATAVILGQFRYGR